MRRGLGTAVAVLATSTALAACGGGDDGGGGGPTRQEYAAQADRVCADLEQRLQQLNTSPPQNEQEALELFDGFRRVVQESEQRLESLPRPSGQDGELATQFTQTFSEGTTTIVEKIDEAEQALRRGDQQGVQQAGQELQDLEAPEFDRLAGEIGAQRCAEG